MNLRKQTSFCYNDNSVFAVIAMTLFLPHAVHSRSGVPGKVIGCLLAGVHCIPFLNGIFVII